ncbi:Uncharacterised protein [Achromobacter denitrificans]|nr:Uncharacterised protein [Achromobacter denitrificans]
MSDTPVLLKSIRSHFVGGAEAVAGGVPMQQKPVVGNAPA